MKGRNRDSKVGLIHTSIFILAGIVIGVFAALITTAMGKTLAKKQMNAAAQYVKQQCIRYEELAAEEVVRSFYAVSDKAFSIRDSLDYSADLAEQISRQAKERGLSGILLTKTDENSVSGRIIAHYSESGENSAMWEQSVEMYGGISKDSVKSYSERLTEKKSDGVTYYYDYAMVARGDGNGAVLCYKRRRVEDVEDERFSIATLLKGYVFGKSGAITVTDGTNVLASNVEGRVGMLAENCPVVRKLREINDDDIIRVEDDGTYYGARTASKNLFVYAYITDAEVFERRTIVLLYLVFLYLLIAVAVISVVQMNAKKRRVEQEIKDEAFRKESERLTREAIRANEAKTDFLRRMSHDIRTPINGIRGMVKIGEYYYDDPEVQKECREKIWNASGYLLDLVNDILDMNKLTTSEPVWKDESFVMSELLDEIGEFMSVQAKEAGILLVFDAKNITHDYLYGCRVQFKRILTNLINNAIKYNKADGKVVLTCIETGCDDDTARFELKCSDTGIGMDEEFIQKMYEPFEREKQFDSNNSEGVGLGLAIVKKIIDRAGWNISVESKKGEGTTFTVNVDFKISEKAKKETDSLKTSGERKLDGINVLVAEDNKINTEIVEFILKVAGANVTSVSDGEQAVEAFKNSEVGEIDVVLMDVMMPVVDGLTATREIRVMNRSDAVTVPIIAMTASAFAEDVENARTAGMDAHIAKPIDGDKLINCIVRLVKKIRGGGRK